MKVDWLKGRGWLKPHAVHVCLASGWYAAVGLPAATNASLATHWLHKRVLDITLYRACC
jgi:hypothetical protein